MAVAAAMILKPLTTRQPVHRHQVIPRVPNGGVEPQTQEVMPNRVRDRKPVVVKVEVRNAAQA